MTAQTTPLPFHQWKDAQVQKDSKANGVFRYYREQSWYWAEYGKFLNRARQPKLARAK